MTTSLTKGTRQLLDDCNPDDGYPSDPIGPTAPDDRSSFVVNPDGTTDVVLSATWGDQCAGPGGVLYFNLYRDGSLVPGYYSYNGFWVICGCYIGYGDTDDAYTSSPNGGAEQLGWGSYSWGAAGIDGNNSFSQGGVGGSFSIYELPRIASLTSPGNGTSVATVAPSLSVYSSPNNENDAVSYYFQVATDAGFSNVVWNSGWVTNPNQTMPSNNPVLLDGNTYYWRVWTEDAHGVQANPSSTWNFTVHLPRFGIGTAQADKGWPMWSDGPIAVNEATGNLVLSAPSPSFATAAGALHAEISYNSTATSNYGLGPGWQIGPQTNLPTKLVNLAVTTAGQQGQQDLVQRVSADGTTESYAHVPGSSIYLPPGGSDSQLTVNSDTAGPDGTPTWTLIDDNGSVYTFAQAHGYTDNTSSNYGVLALTSAQTLSSISPIGPKLLYTYTTSLNTQYLTQVAAKDGAATIGNGVLNLYWHVLDQADCPNAVLCIVGPDGVKWQYFGDAGASGTLQRVNDFTRDLFKIVYASSVPQYLYNADELAPGYSGSAKISLAFTSSKLSSISQGPINDQTPTTSTWTFQYNTGGTTHATKVAHTDPVTGQTRIAVAQTRPAAGNTVVKSPCEQPSVSCPGQDDTGGHTVYYDGNDLIMERDGPLGASDYTQEQFNTNGQLVWSEDQGSTGDPSDYAYDAVDQTLTSATAADPGTGRPVTRYNYDETAYGTGTYTPGPALHGLQAYYYKTTHLVPATGGSIAEATTNEAGSSGLAFNWGGAGPPALPGTTTGYSVRIEGDLTVPTSNNYEFQIVGDGCEQLVIDNQALVYNWGASCTNPSQTLTDVSPAMSLTAGKHKLVLTYAEPNSPPNSNFGVLWICTDGSSCGSGAPTTPTTIPSSALTPAWDNQTSVVSPEGRVTFTHFNQPSTSLPDYTLRVVAGQNLISSYSYDALGRISQSVPPRGNAARGIDGNGNLTGSANSSYATTNSYYVNNASPSLPSHCAGGGTPGSQAELLQTVTPQVPLAPTNFVYDGGNRVLATTDGAGTTCLSYNSEGRALTTTDGDGNVTSYGYDASGNQTSVTDPLGRTASEGFDEASRLSSSTDRRGATTSNAYDADGNLISSQSAGVAASGNEITDLVRTAGSSGDGRSSDSSYGIYDATANFVANSSFETNTNGWAAVGSGVTITRDVTAGNSKFGAGSLNVTTPGNGAREGATYTTAGGLNLAANGSIDVSGWIKASSNASLNLRVVLHFTDGTGVAYSDDVSATTSWSRVPGGGDWFTVPSGETLDSVTLVWRTAGTLAASFWLDGVQIEPHTFATPYVASTTAAGHRSAGRLLGTTAGLNAGGGWPAQGWVALRLRAGLANADLSSSETPYAFRWGDDPSHYLSLSLNGSGQWVLDRQAGGGAATATVSAGSFAPGSYVTLVATWSGSTLTLNYSVNGSQFLTTPVANTAVPNLTSKSFDIGSNGQGVDLNGEILWFAAGTATLNSGDLTSFPITGTNDPQLSNLPPSARFAWSADNTNYQSTTPDFTTSYTYDDADNRISITSPNGNTTHYGYDALGRLISTTSPLNEVTTASYDALGRVIARTDANGNYTLTPTTDGTTTYGYDRDGNLLSASDASGITHYAYDAAGRLSSINDANNHLTSYGYDLDGNRTSVTAADGGVAHFGYDTAGDQSWSTPSLDPSLTTDVQFAPHKTTYGYDAGGRLNSTTLPTNETITTVWDAAGNKHTTTDPVGQPTTFSYDADNELISTTTPLNETSRLSYDENGNVATRTNELGYTTRYGYDWANRLTIVTDPLGDSTSSSYDGDGNRLSRTDPLGNTTRWVYDQDDRVQKIIGPDGDSSHATTLSYDRNGNLIARVDPLGHETDYSYFDDYYQDDHLKQKVVDPGSGHLNQTWSYTYDPVGNRKTLSDGNGATTTYSYDPTDRLAGLSYSGGSSTPAVSYGFDYAGNRTSMTDTASNSEYYGYDNSNRLSDVCHGHTVSGCPAGSLFHYTYTNGRLASRAYPDGTSTGYGYDNDGQLHTVTVGSSVTTYGYDLAGQLISKALPNDWTESRSYDSAGDLTYVHSSKSGQTAIAAVTYSLDAAGNPTHIVRDGADEYYDYDAANRVKDVCYGHVISGCSAANLITYAYDKVGNRTSQVNAGTATTYSYDNADELMSAAIGGGATTTYSYDHNGNERTAGSRTINYNVANQVTSILDGGTTTASFSYNGLGNRLTKTAAGVTTSYLWDENASLPELAEEKNGATVLRSYEYGFDTGGGLDPVSIKAAGTTMYMHQTDVGSTAAVTNGSGSVEWTYTYDPYGNAKATTKVDSSAPDNVARFAGEMLDGETGFYDLRARLYDPGTGRFLGVDPADPVLGNPAASVYSYASGNPLTGIDPSGFYNVDYDGESAAAAYYQANPGADPNGGNALYDAQAVEQTLLADWAASNQTTVGAVTAAIAGADATAENTSLNFVSRQPGGGLGSGSGCPYGIAVPDPSDPLHKVTGSCSFPSTAFTPSGALNFAYLSGALWTKDCNIDPALLGPGTTTLDFSLGGGNASSDCDLYNRYLKSAQFSTSNPPIPPTGGGGGGGNNPNKNAAKELPPELKALAEAHVNDSGTTVLGSYRASPTYIEKAIERGASYFDIGNAWNSLTPEQRSAANVHFLDVIADQEDRVLLNVPKTQIREGSYLADEVTYLTQQRGYVWVNQWALRPGG